MNIGDVVLVTALAQRNDTYDELGQLNGELKWSSVPLEPNKIGVITGKTYRCDGIYRAATRTGYYGEEETPAYLQITKKHEVYLVRFGWTRKEVAVFEWDLRSTDPANFKLPHR